LNRSRKTEEIEISGFNANANWYQIQLNKGSKGWMYGAGLNANQNYYETCILYFELYPKGKYISEIKDYFTLCDCNEWEVVKEKDNKASYLRYLKYFPNGIYSKDAELISGIIGKTICYYNENEDATSFKHLKLKYDGINVSGEMNADNMYFSSHYKLNGKRSGKKIELKGVGNNSDVEYGEKELKIELSFFLKSENKIIENGINEYSKKSYKHLFLRWDCNRM
jgi:hypothetical protein